MLSKIVIISLIITIIDSTLTPKSPRGAKVPKLDEIKKGPQNYTVFDHKLVVEHPHSKDISVNHQAFFRETDEYKFDSLVLGYVTPWNNHGYDVAKIFGNKFTHISPVWLQIRRKGDKLYEVTGLHDVDKDWMVHVKNAGRERRLKIVPRILFEAWTGSDFTNLLSSESEIQAFCKVLQKTCYNYDFNGFVFEIWSQLAGRIDDKLLVNLIKRIGDALTLENYETILVIPPKRGNENLFTEHHLNELYDYVAAFSLMTYDFSNPQNPGPNAPLPWAEDCIKSLSPNKEKRHKILTGLNFYGNDYTASSGGPIIGSEYLKKLKAFNGKLKYDSKIVEHYFEFKDSNSVVHVVFYPTLFSINKRLKLFQDLGTGVSIWELGQGLDYFYDLF